METGKMKRYKEELRRQLREESGKLPGTYYSGASRMIEERVLSLPEYQASRVMMAYVSLPKEPETSGILEDALRQGKTVLLPRCINGEEMEALPFTGFDVLIRNRMGILEPAPGAENVPAPDLILVPCVAAAPDGSRLGHGAGYYDRFLSKIAARTVCLCFHAFLLQEIPMAETDIRMDCVLTEKQIF